MTINREAFQAWVDALRSGHYQQGKGALVRVSEGNRTYCCLGVACDTFAEQLGLTETSLCTDDFGTDDDDMGRLEYIWKGEKGESIASKGDLPTPVIRLLGLEGYMADPVVKTEDGDDHLIGLNDDHGWTFDQIADAIEATYLTGDGNA